MKMENPKLNQEEYIQTPQKEEKLNHLTLPKPLMFQSVTLPQSKKFLSVIGDKYVDPDSKERQYQMEKKKKNNHDQEWKPADGTKTE